MSERLEELLQNDEVLPPLFAMAARALETYSTDDLLNAQELAPISGELPCE